MSCKNFTGETENPGVAYREIKRFSRPYKIPDSINFWGICTAIQIENKKCNIVQLYVLLDRKFR